MKIGFLESWQTIHMEFHSDQKHLTLYQCLKDFIEKVIKNLKKLADDNKSVKIQVMGKVLDFHNGNFQLLIRANS